MGGPILLRHDSDSKRNAHVKQVRMRGKYVKISMKMSHMPCGSAIVDGVQEWNPDRPYNDLPPPPSADDLETRRVLKAAIGANAALAQLDQAVVSIPNPAVLISCIPILEAQASSEIENIVTTTDELFRHLDDDVGADPATRETLRYRTALRAGFDHTLDRGLTTSTASAVCSTITGCEMKVRALPGTRIVRPGTGEVIYTPPRRSRSHQREAR